MRKTATRVGAALVVATAGIAAGQATAQAEPTGPLVRYTITTAAPYEFGLYYVTAQPASMDAYNADPYAYVKNETRVFLTPEAPFVFEAPLSDPQWALMSVSSTTKGSVGPPFVHCDITVDGQVISAHDDPYNVRCQGTQW